jgi:hypothetical protein
MFEPIHRLFEGSEKWLEEKCQALSKLAPDSTLLHTNGDPYLHRFYLWRRSDAPSWVPSWFKRNLPGIYLHYFHRGDLDKELHNHPWGGSLSLIITNGYREERLTETGVVSRLIRPGSLNFIRYRDFHRVDLINPTKGAWTLFFSGARVQDWGFIDPDTRSYTDWETFVAERDNQLTVSN